MAVKEQLDRLAAFEPAPYPVVSLYLNTQPGQTGRDQFHTFVRKEFAARGRTYPAGSPERESLDKDLERISRFLDNEIEPAANGVAVFACSAGELFEAVQMSAPIDDHWLYIGDQPHLYPLARIESLHPACAIVLADTNAARIMVFADGRSGLAGRRHRRQDQAHVRRAAGRRPATSATSKTSTSSTSRKSSRRSRRSSSARTFPRSSSPATRSCCRCCASRCRSTCSRRWSITCA